MRSISPAPPARAVIGAPNDRSTPLAMIIERGREARLAQEGHKRQMRPLIWSEQMDEFLEEKWHALGACYFF
ncbi:hypothetical protein JOH50_002993 [Rhizobium leguminosarum]|nr:hypothetical protein [Rhizobium leguminosarum]